MSQRTVVATGHLGEWLQGRLGPDGPVCLVTLPCPKFEVTTHASLGRPPNFAADLLDAFCAELGLPHREWPNLIFEMPIGAGAGASTASLVGFARALGYDADPLRLARACVQVEGASDPTMLRDPDRVLWASREGRILEHLPSPPPCEIVGGFWGPAQPTDPQDCRFADISDLVPQWRAACLAKDLGHVAALAQESADRTSHIRGPLGPLAELARSLGALGYVRAHTGSARGLVFAPDTVPSHVLDVMQDAGLQGIVQFRTGAS